MLFLGRHAGFPIALEGALKLKELAYIHAEGFAAGELKHGPIALIEPGLPVFCVVPPQGRDQLHDKMVSAIQEIRARGCAHDRAGRGRRPGHRGVRRHADPAAAGLDAAAAGRRPSYRSSCSPASSRRGSATTSTSRATWPSPSRSSRLRRGDRRRRHRRGRHRALRGVAARTPGLADAALHRRPRPTGRWPRWPRGSPPRRRWPRRSAPRRTWPGTTPRWCRESSGRPLFSLRGTVAARAAELGAATSTCPSPTTPASRRPWWCWSPEVGHEQAHTVEQVRAAEAALMAQAARGRADAAGRGRAGVRRCIDLLGRRLRRAGCCCSSARATTAATRCTPARCWRGGARGSRRVAVADRAARGAVSRRCEPPVAGWSTSASVADARRRRRRHRRHRRPPGAAAAGGGGASRASPGPDGRGRHPERASTSTPDGSTGAHVTADLTVTFGTHKVCHLVEPAASACGVVQLVDIGLDLPEAAVTAFQATTSRRCCRGRSPTPRSTPAASSASAPARSATRARACSRRPGRPAGWSGWSGTPGGARRGARAPTRRWSSARGACRPGWSAPAATPSAAEALAAALRDDVPLVVDADALQHLDAPLDRPALLTPHAGELAAMLGVERAEVEADQLALRPPRGARSTPPRCCSRATTRSSPPPTAGSASPPPGRRGSPSPAPATCWADSAARCSPPVSRRTTPASVGSWLHGAAATLASPGRPDHRPDVAAPSLGHRRPPR